MIKWLSAFLIVSAVFTSAALAFAGKPHFSRFDLGTDHTFKAPLKLLKSRNGQFWYFFNDHILIKSGVLQQQLSLRHLVKKSTDSSIRLELLELENGVLFAREKALFFIDFKQLVIQPIPFDYDEFIMGLAQTDDGGIWLAAFNGIYRASSLNQPFAKIDLPATLSTKQLLAMNMLSIGNNKLLVSTAYSTVIEINYVNGKPIEAKQLPFKSPYQKDYLYSMARSGQQLYLGARLGLYRFDLQTQQQYELPNPDQTITSVRSLSINNDQLWFAANGRLYQTDLTFGSVLSFESIDNFHFDLSANYVTTLYSDDEGNSWIGVKNQGLYQYSHALNRFNAVTPQWLHPQITQLPQRIDLRSTTSPVFLIKDKSFLPFYDLTIDEEVSALAVLDNHRFWYGAYDKLALVENAKVTKQINTGQRAVTSLALSGDDVWFTRSIGGLFRYRANSNKTEAISSVPLQQLFVLALNSNELLSFSSENIVKIDPAKPLTPQLLFTFEHTAIDSRIVGQQITLFFDNGDVSLFDLAQLALQPLSFAPVTTLCAVQQLNTDNWWLAQDNGTLLSYNQTQNDYHIYNGDDGLPIGGVNGRFCGYFQGELLFSTATGFFAITEHLNYHNPKQPKSTLYYSTNGQQTKQVAPLQPIKITHDSFPMTFQVTNSSFQNPKRNRVLYQIKGLSDHWKALSPNSDSKEINLLPEGRYTLSTKVSNNDEVWSDTQTLSFVVLPPFWLSRTAELIYLLLFLLLVGATYLYRTRSIRARALTLQKSVAQKTAQILTEKQTVEKLLSLKEQEFIHVSHELRTPLTLMIGPLKLARAKTQEANTVKALDMAIRNGERLHRMVDQLLHIERFKVENVLARTVQNIGQIVHQISDSFALYALNKHIKIQLETPTDCYMQFVPDAFEKIFINLLSNAVKYTNNGGHIEVNCSIDNQGGLCLSVKDNGIGIKTEDLPRLFDKFYRIGNAHSDNQSGAGVGLALVKTLVESHHGQITVDSQYGEGTTVTVRFPASLRVDKSNASTINEDLVSQELSSLPSTTTTAQINPPHPSLADDNQLTLLIIEDTEDMRSYINDILSEHYQCHCAANGQLGLELAQQLIPDIIVCDVMMPVMDGFELTRLVKENPITAHIPVILLTARGDKDSRLTGWKALADDYIAKPFDSQELIIRADNLVSLRKLLRQRYSTQVLQGKPVGDEPDSSLNEKDATFINKVTAIINQNLHEESFSTEQLSEQVFMSERQLQRKLKALIDFSPREYLQHLRLIRAESLLLKGERVTDVSMNTGFSSSSYFTRCFKAKNNMTPKQFATNDADKTGR